MDSYIVLDIETTGLSPERDQIIELGALKVKNGMIQDTFCSFVNPNSKLSSRIIDLTGITDDMLWDSPEIESVLKKFISFSRELPILGHNIRFDYSFLKVNFEKIGLSYEREGIDTLKLSKAFHQELASKSLANLCIHYNISNPHAHRALDDAKATYELYCKLKERFQDKDPAIFQTTPLYYKIKKVEPITKKQINYLNDLLKYHKIEHEHSILGLTKSEASRMIDRIILTYGRLI